MLLKESLFWIIKFNSWENDIEIDIPEIDLN